MKRKVRNQYSILVLRSKTLISQISFQEEEINFEPLMSADEIYLSMTAPIKTVPKETNQSMNWADVVSLSCNIKSSEYHYQ